MLTRRRFGGLVFTKGKKKGKALKERKKTLLNGTRGGESDGGCGKPSLNGEKKREKRFPEGLRTENTQAAREGGGKKKPRLHFSYRKRTIPELEWARYGRKKSTFEGGRRKGVM